MSSFASPRSVEQVGRRHHIAVRTSGILMLLWRERERERERRREEKTQLLCVVLILLFTMARQESVSEG